MARELYRYFKDKSLCEDSVCKENSIFKGPHFAGLFFMFLLCFIGFFFVFLCCGNDFDENLKKYLENASKDACEFRIEKKIDKSSHITLHRLVGGQVNSLLTRLPRGFVYQGAERYQCKKRNIDLESIEGVKDAKRRLDSDRRLRKKLRKKLGSINGKSLLEIKINYLYEIIVQKEAEIEKTRQRERAHESFSKKVEWIEKDFKDPQKGRDFDRSEELNKLQNFKEILLSYKSEGGSVVLLGEKQLAFCEIELENGSKEQFKIYKKRVSAIIKTLRSSPKVGDFLYQNINKEASELLAENTELTDAFGDIESIQNLSDIVSTSAQTVFDCNKEKEYDLGYSLLDFAHTVFGAAKQTSKFIFLSAKGVANGSWNITTFTAKLAKNLLTSPVKTSVGLVSSVASITEKVVRASWLAVSDSDEFVKKICDKVQTLEKSFNRLSYEEKVVKTSEFATELLFPIASTKLHLFRRIKNLSKTVGRAVKTELKIQKTVSTVFKESVVSWKQNFGQALLPLKTGILDAYESIKFNTLLWSNYAKSSAIGVKKTIKKTALKAKGCKEIIDIGNTVIDCAELVKANMTWDIKALLHVCKGRFNLVPKDIARRVGGKESFVCLRKGLRTGMHTEQGFKHIAKMCGFDMKRIKITTLKNGVMVVELPKDYFMTDFFRNISKVRMKIGARKIKGAKTLWPSKYTPTTIRESVKEIIGEAKNFVKTEKDGSLIFKGIDKFGVKAKVVLNKDKTVKTAFPLVI